MKVGLYDIGDECPGKKKYVLVCAICVWVVAVSCVRCHFPDALVWYRVLYCQRPKNGVCFNIRGPGSKAPSPRSSVLRVPVVALDLDLELPCLVNSE